MNQRADNCNGRFDVSYWNQLASIIVKIFHMKVRFNSSIII